MRYMITTLLIAFVAKDIIVIGDPYYIRATAQGAALVVAIFWCAKNLSLSTLKRYWPFFGYIFALFMSLINVYDSFYVILQIISLTAVILFFIAYFESVRVSGAEKGLPQTSLFMVLFMIATFSALCAAVVPSLVYYPISIDETRFRGIFAMPAMMGSAAGLLVGLSIFGQHRLWIRLLAITAGVTCLGLTLSRTCWVATVAASLLTTWFFVKRGRQWVAVAMGGMVVVVCLYVASGEDGPSAIDRIVRVKSIPTLTGRLSIWQKSFDAFTQRPMFGQGFTVGGRSLDDKADKVQQAELFRSSSGGDRIIKESERSIGKLTLHNGYLQSLLDLGLFGTFFYLSAILLSIFSLYRITHTRKFSVEFYGLIFFTVENISQNVIYSAAVFDSILFWALAVFSLSLDPAKLSNNSEQTMESIHGVSEAKSVAG